ncbi:hypothetical protein JI58_10340 [Marinosulfonomonas sp. PRT-SC04]|nr:hypothetical protein JI58_10340 [Marinosulfonomonas sp. PRT-SC04]
MIDVIGTESFFPDIVKIVEQRLSFDGLLMCLYSKDNAPTSLGCFNEALNFQTGIQNYLKYSYILNPVYHAFQNDIAAGAYIMDDILPQDQKSEVTAADFHIWIDDQETIGYRTPGWPKNIEEVLGLIPLPDNKMIELCFMNRKGTTKVQRCQADLQSIFPVLASTFRKHFEFAAHDFDTTNAEPNIKYQILDFGSHILTEREQSIVQLILKGYSSNSIALVLKISLPTVKTHRRNIYAKLNISSQVELFNLYLSAMMASSP